MKEISGFPRNGAKVGAILCAAVMSCLFAVGCTKRQGPGDAITESYASGERQLLVIEGSGSDGMLDLVTYLGESFLDEHPDVYLRVTGGGNDQGIRRLMEGSCDIAHSSRKVTDAELSAARKQGKELVETVIAWQAFAINVNATTPLSGLTASQIVDIFRGTKTNWREFDGPDCPIVPVKHTSRRSAPDLFQEIVLNGKPFGDNLERVTGDPPLFRVMFHEGGIAYSNIGLEEYFNEHLSKYGKIKALEIDGVMPNRETVREGGYPLADGIRLYTFGPLAGAAQEFVEFALSDFGQEIVEYCGQIPLADIRRRSRRKPKVPRRVVEMESPPMPGHLRIAGAECMRGVSRAWTEAFMMQHPGTKFTVGRGRSGNSGIDLQQGKCELFNSESELHENAIALVRGGFLIEAVVAHGAIVIIVNKGNPVTDLTKRQIKDAFTGRITNWKELGGPDLEIVVVDQHRGTGYTMREALRTRLLDREGLTKRKKVPEPDRLPGRALSLVKGGISFTSISDPAILDAEVKLVAIDGVQPSPQNIRDGTYPLSRKLRVVRRSWPLGLEKEYVDFILSDEGQRIVEKMGFAPIR